MAEPSGSGRAFKRQRVDAYPKGSIIKVEVHNFMTYQHTVIEPGPKLNLVLGPNGTGKSSLVCAISIGLGGRTSLLGRAEDLRDYVRRGDDVQRGWVEITLSSGDPMRPHVVRREMHKADNSSTWRVNGREARLKDVEELVREKLKVQLDNLCQFLPQDKVVEFARMKPVDLLEATEKAIGNGELYEQHQQLIEARKELAVQDAHKEALEASVAGLRAENDRNKRDVQNIQQQQALLDQVALAQKKLPWQEYEQQRQQWQRDKDALKQARDQLIVLQRTAREDEGPLAERQQRLQQLRALKQKVESEIKAADAKITGGPVAGSAGRGRQNQQQQAGESKGLEEEMGDALTEMQTKQGDLASLEAQAAERERRIGELEGEVAELAIQVEALPPLGDAGEMGEERQQRMREQQDVRQQATMLDIQLEELHSNKQALEQQRRQAADRLHRMDNAKMQRLRKLDERNPGIYRAWEWVQANKARFRGPVYGPIAVEVECPDPFHQKCLEGQVAAQVWSFFVTKFQDDQDLLKIELAKLQAGMARPFVPSMSNYTGDADAEIPHPEGEASAYARYGISQTLDRVFTAPKLVKHVLCDQSSINKAYVGSSSAQLVEQLFRDNSRIQMVWTPEANYRRTRSQYNAAAESTLVADLREPRLLGGGGNADDGREREELQAEMRRCEQDLAGVDGELQELGAARREKEEQVQGIKRQLDELERRIRAVQKQHQALRTRLKSKTLELDRLRKSPDPRKKGPKLMRELQAAKKRALDKALELSAVQAANGARLARWAELDLGVREANMQCDLIREASKRHQAELARWQRIVDALTKAANDSKERTRRLKETAEQEAPLTGELHEAFAELPDTLEDLRQYIDQKSAEAEGMLIANPAALRQFNDRQAKITVQEGELRVVEERRQLARATIDDVAAVWLPELKHILARINQTFSANFQSVGCAGEVTLHEAPGQDFEKYAIEIRVKFRDEEELQTLDASRQSGGERSVSTIIYIIALQGVTVTPFRVVDEINQGMDAINERKVFMQLVDAACREGTPQCFLLTPKLLPDLPFTRDVTVLQIFNGHRIKDVASRYSMERLLGRQRMAALTAAS